MTIFSSRTLYTCTQAFPILLHLAYLSKKLTGNSMQGLFGPSSEPVNGDIVHHSREVSAAGLEGLSHRGHAEYNVEVVGTLFDKV